MGEEVAEDNEEDEEEVIADDELGCHLSEVKGMHAEGAECHDQKPSQKDVEACKALCMELEECSSFDYNIGDEPFMDCRCWIHYEHYDFLQHFLEENENVNHYTKAGSDC